MANRPAPAPAIFVAESVRISKTASVLFDLINRALTDDDLHRASGLVWEALGQDKINDDEATYLSESIERRRPSRQAIAPIGGALRGRITRFFPRRPQRSHDRDASRQRRRELGGSSALPAELRRHYTEGQRSALCVIAGEVKRQGICDLPIDAIAARAGCCRTTVQNAMRIARSLSHLKVTERPRRGQKHLPNIIEIANAEWFAWTKRAPSPARGIGFKTITKLHPTKSVDQKKQEDAFEAERFRWARPPWSGRSRTEPRRSA
ncbi:MAG TPA: hypothetical protein VGR70_10915 [Stellaceae bacterium]|nr:hypothetical protein [Stellaceae bacterium]